MVNPSISIVMSVYNGEKDLAKTIDSILLQTYIDFEFIIINDGSTDNTSKILTTYIERDKRIRIIEQENLGLTKALIRGCKEACGEYIARQDVGDVSLPQRLKKQIELLSSKQKLVMCGCWARMLGPNNEVLAETKRPLDPKIATHQLLYEKKAPAHHGSVMFSKKAYEKVGGYRYQFYYGQDSDLWLRLGKEGLISYVQDFLYEYRFNYNDISLLKIPIQSKYGELGQACHKAKLKDESEEPYLKQALQLQTRITDKNKDEEWSLDKINYFIGSCLLKRKDRRALPYLLRAFIYNPLHLLMLAKIISALFLFIPRHLIAPSKKNSIRRNIDEG